MRALVSETNGSDPVIGAYHDGELAARHPCVNPVTAERQERRQRWRSVLAHRA